MSDALTMRGGVQLIIRKSKKNKIIQTCVCGAGMVGGAGSGGVADTGLTSNPEKAPLGTPGDRLTRRDRNLAGLADQVGVWRRVSGGMISGHDPFRRPLGRGRFGGVKVGHRRGHIVGAHPWCFANRGDNIDRCQNKRTRFLFLFSKFFLIFLSYPYHRKLKAIDEHCVRVWAGSAAAMEGPG